MKTAIVVMLAATAGLVAPAWAAPPANKDACLAKAFSLAEAAAKKKLATDAAAKVEDLVSAVEAKCAAGELAGAETAIAAAEAALAGK